MCGLVGLWDPGASGSGDGLAATARRMADTLAHRGPDSDGVWCDAGAGFALGHRRLAILDLSPAGHQPMVSASGRFVIAYNGEIYNFRDLRAELETAGHRFRGDSDTEVLLEAWEAWGAERTLGRLIGMFAIAVWDRESRRLSLVRDRLGIKPLYWSQMGGRFLFGSELKALAAHPAWAPALDTGAVAAFLRHLYVPAPATIYKDVHKLPPGTLLEVAAEGKPRMTRYWRMEDAVEAGRRQPTALSDGEATEALEALLGDAVERRMIADVPLGGFLSGGVDSSTVAALMRARATGPVRTFSIGFREKGYDEAAHAAEVAAHLGTEHTELYVEPKQALDVIPGLASIYDEPFADVSQVPTYLLSKLTRQHVTVALSGDGGDELFAGYVRHLLAAGAWPRLSRTPRALRMAAAAGVRAISPRGWDRAVAALPRRLQRPRAGDNLHKFAAVVAARGDNDLYRRVTSYWDAPEAVLADRAAPCPMPWDAAETADDMALTTRIRYFDAIGYLPDDILTKVDRASMAVGLEARVPILDHRVVEFAFALPMHQLVRGGQSKWLLRQVLYRHVPKALIDRPKMGFAVPLDSWLRGPLRDWAEEMLDEHRLRQEGVFDPAPIRRRWQEHLSGRRNWQYHLWAVLMFQAWFAQWKPALAEAA